MEIDSFLLKGGKTKRKKKSLKKYIKQIFSWENFYFVRKTKLFEGGLQEVFKI